MTSDDLIRLMLVIILFAFTDAERQSNRHANLNR